MHIITKKVTLKPAPFVGTTITVRVGEGLMFKLRRATLADGCDKITVDWGDGSESTVFDSTIGAAEHVYQAQGEYAIRISDDISRLIIGHSNSASEYSSVYAPMVSGFTSNATRLTAITNHCFHNCRNLSRFDISKSAVSEIAASSFIDCAALSGDLDFPKVDNITGEDYSLPFGGCPNITGLHFSLSNRAVIESLPVWEISNHNLGAENATVFFDL